MVTPRKGNFTRLGGHADPGVPPVSALGVSAIRVSEGWGYVFARGIDWW